MTPAVNLGPKWKVKSCFISDLANDSTLIKNRLGKDKIVMALRPWLSILKQINLSYKQIWLIMHHYAWYFHACTHKWSWNTHSLSPQKKKLSLNRVYTRVYNSMLVCPLDWVSSCYPYLMTYHGSTFLVTSYEGHACSDVTSAGTNIHYLGAWSSAWIGYWFSGS